MKCLIVGASGFVGGYLIERLQADGEQVIATKLPNERESASVQWLDLNVCDADAVRSLLDAVQPDCIFHLAAQSSVKESWKKPQQTAEINIIGAINLFEGVRKSCPNAKIVVIGSSEEYGDIDYEKNVCETVVPNPSNIYAATKFAQENIAQVYVNAYHLHIVLTRSFNHIGPKQSKNFVVADFCSQVAEIEKGNLPAQIHVGNLSAYRDFSDVRDIVRAYAVLSKYGADGEVYNVGSGKAVQVSAILQMILELSEVPIEVIVDSDKFRPIDTLKIQADITKIKKLKWKPTIPLKETLMDTLEFFRQ